MAKQKKEKAPTYTYIKEFADFGEGYKELISLIPDVSLYGGDSPVFEDVVNNLAKVITDNIPSPTNENYPNTFSFSISAKELGFLTDDAIAFGWRLFADTKNEDEFIYQFRITFLTLSISKRRQIDKIVQTGWKDRDLSDKQSRFWNDLPSGQRLPTKDTHETPASPTTPNTNVQEVYEEPQAVIPAPSPVPQAAPAPTQAVQTLVSPNQQVDSVNTAIQEAAPVVQPPQPAPLIQQHQANQPIVKVSDTESQIQAQQASEQVKLLALQSCNILPSGSQAVFIITHYGNQMVININDRNEGVFVDRASYTIKIDNVLYNYRDFHVDILDADYQPEQAQFAPGFGGKRMRVHQPLEDAAFVGGKLINPIDPNAPDPVVIAPPKRQLTPQQQKMAAQRLAAQNAAFNLIPPTIPQQNVATGGQPAGRNFVIDRTSKSAGPSQTNGIVDQVVRVTDNLYGQNG